MGIDNVAIKTFNSSGSQSVCRANEADETKTIESDFLTKCTTKYINGSGVSFTPGIMNLTSMQTTSPSETFTLPCDIDAISEVSLQMRMTNATAAVGLSPTFLLDLIKKIEIKLGNLVVQTILPGDIYARNLTEFGNAIDINSFNPNIDSTTGGLLNTSKFIDFSISIPFTGRSFGVNKCFLQAGAITNNLTIKVYYNKLAVTSTADSPLAVDGLSSGVTDNCTLSTGVCVLSHSITSTEKNFIAGNIINRPVNTSQSVVKSITSANGPITIDLSSININVSHILLTLNGSIFSSSGAVVTSATDTTSTTWSDSAPNSDGIYNNAVGVIYGWLKSAELILGNDRTGNVPGSCLTTNNLDLFKLSSVNKNIYILKLADSAFSTAGIPFSRLNNKKLVITYADDITISPYQSSGSGENGVVNINVTCCGTQIQSTVGGAISFSS